MDGLAVGRAALATAVAMLATTAMPVMAREEPATVALPDDAGAANDDATRNTLTIGAGGGFVPSYEGSDDYVFIPVGALRARVSGFTISTRGTQLSADLIRDSHGGPGWNVQLGPAINLNLNRTGRVVDPQVRALGKRHVALEVGGAAGISRTGVITSAYDSLGVRVAVLADVSGVHRSWQIAPSIDYGTPLSRRAYIAFSASATIVGDSYARTYFGIDSAGSLASGLPVFANPKGGLKSIGGTFLATRSLTGDLTHGLGLYAAASYNRLQGDFARSPIVAQVGSADQWVGALGIGYTF